MTLIKKKLKCFETFKKVDGVITRGYRSIQRTIAFIT